ncbi:MAG: ATP-dependent DNA helicase RecG [Pseudonocardiales bacterium]
MVALDSKLSSVIGGKSAKVLADGLDLHTVGDLLRHYPRRYQQRGELTDLSDLRVGERVTVFAEVQGVSGRRIRPKLHKTDVVVSDGHRSLDLTFFNQPWRERELRRGRRAFFEGTVEVFNRKRQLTNPYYELVDDDEGVVAAEFAGQLVAIYPSTAKVNTFTVQRCVRLVLDQLDAPPDPLPDLVRGRRRLVGLATALHDIHRPASREDVQAAETRLKWDEALALQVTLAQRRAAAAGNPATPRPPVEGGLLAAFDRRLHFTLTDGQTQIGQLLADELAGPHPMHRLLQGEVGSGKTVIALRAMLQVIDAGAQAALLTPTEVLAAQHAASLRGLLGPLAQAGELGAAEAATRVTLLTGSQSAPARRRALAEASSGEAGIVVGTHALLQETVGFADLGLVVIDEQHRFGVEQRDALRAKAVNPPHLLVMTATPIPRTVAMTVYGDLETSALRELPRGRSPIESLVVPAAEKPAWLDRAWERVIEEAGHGHQAFVVCPRIGEESDTFDSETGTALVDDGQEGRRPPLAVSAVYAMLRAGPFAGLSVDMLHGRLAAEDKDAVMRRFARGETDVLVATTVVEVGIDVPNATIMVVMDADRFGVSQLHQLRGRIGRGTAPGLCLLVTDAEAGSPARERLAAVSRTSDGFALARLDLQQRREGDVLGAAQSGRRRQVRLLSLLRDEDIIVAARAEATALVAADPALSGHPALAEAVADLIDEEQAEYLEKA